MCEFITAGGFAGQDLPQKLLQEGLLMRDALLRDLSELGIEIVTTTDARLQPNSHAVSRLITSTDDAWQVWQICMQQADAVWLIAPETDEILLKLTQMAVLEGAWILGCRPAEITVCSSKYQTFLQLSQASVAHVPSYTPENWPRLPDMIYLAKPDDGAGCEDAVLFAHAADLAHWLDDKPDTKYVVQPYLAGTAASVSCIMQAGRALLLSVNRQYVERQNNTLIFRGVSVNALPELWQVADKLVRQIAAAMPDLRGYIGIDVIVQDGELLVLEINPRLTTSYVGLRESIGCNPAELILQMLENPDFVPENLTRKSVEIHV